MEPMGKKEIQAKIDANANRKRRDELIENIALLIGAWMGYILICTIGLVAVHDALQQTSNVSNILADVWPVAVGFIASHYTIRHINRRLGW